MTREKLSRLLPVDALRGLIIVVMALDHANHFVAQKHSPGEYWGGPFPAYQEALPFLTRLVTHLAAPGFFFLMGAGMLLFTRSRQRLGWGKWAIARYFWIRGGLLIALQLLLVNRAWEMSPGGWGLDIYIGVLFALGGAMILGTLFLWLKPGYLLLITIALFISTELLHPSPEIWNTLPIKPVNLLLFYPGGDQGLWSNYPILPWLELVVFGLFFGHWLGDDTGKAYDRGLKLGVAFLLVFLLLRTLDGFGNVRPRAGDSWIDFLNVVKYPPSMTFTFLTMGFNLILLWIFAQLAKKWSNLLQPLAVFGRSPLFFYVLHLFLYAGIGYLFAPEGSTVAAIYPYWLLGILILFPCCLWYSRLKQHQPAGSILRYL